MKRALLAVLILAIVLQLIVAALLGTEPGSRWLIYRLLPLVPGHLQISQINGTVLEGVAFTDATYQLDGLSLRLESAQLAINSGKIWQGWLQAEHLYLRGLEITLADSPIETEAEFALPDRLTIPFGIAITTGRLSNLQVFRNQRPVLQLDLLELDNTFARTELDIGRLKVQQEQHQASLNDTTIELVTPYPVKANLRWQTRIPDLARWLGSDQLSGDARITGSLVHLSVRHRLVAPQQINSQIDVDPFSAEHNFTSQHQWKDIFIALPNYQSVELSSGELNLNSKQGMVSLSSKSFLRLGDIAGGELKISAEGDWQQAKQISIAMQSGASTARLTGTARWLPDIDFNLIADGRNIDPALLDPRFSGNVNLSGNLAGRRIKDSWQAIADSIYLSGRLRDRPLEATLQAAIHDDVLSLSGKAEYDHNQISIDGKINQTIDLRSQLQMANPQSLHSDLRGSANIDVHLYGTRSQPLLDIDAASDRIGFAQYTIENVRIQGVQLGPGSPDMQLSIASDKILYYNSSLLMSTRLQLQGSHSNHRLSWSLHQDAARLSGSAHGAVDATSLDWNGEIDQLTLTLTDFPDWQLMGPAALSVASERQRLEKVCLSDGSGQACASAAHANQLLSASLAINSLPIAPFSALLGPDIALSGKFQHNSDIRRDEAGSWYGHLHSALTEAVVTFDEGSTDYSLAVDQAELSATLQRQKIESTLSLVMAQHGYLQASINTEVGANAPLDGQLDVAITELRWLELLIPGIRQRSGSITGELSLSGRRDTPQLHGVLNLEDGETDIASAGLTLRNSRARLSGEGRRISITGSSFSGPGSVDVTGHIDLSEGLPGKLDLQLTGERFQILDLPEATMLVNPTVTLNGDMRLFRLRGDIQIPEARLAPQQLPEVAVRVSEDQVIVNSLRPPVDPLKIDAELMLIIGKDVRFTGFGLDARLGGNLQYIQKPEQPVNLLGDLRIEDGRYRAYGQNLAIDQGVLLFQDKIDNPGLNIRAVRRIPSAQIVAGVAISGTLQRPEARLVSEPPMEESEIMAWLLTGRGLTAGSGSDNAMIAQALAVYGLEQGRGVTEKIGSKLGLDEITLGSEWESSDASLMLGKQISNRLYLSYAIGLFDAVSTVMLRYTLSRRVHLEAQSGANQQSLDLIYQVER